MAYSIDPISANCYPDTTVLINKFDIRDEKKLNEKAIHHFLFSDLYDWADEVRTVNISKKGTQFTPAEKIPALAERIFKRLNSMKNLKGLPYCEFVDEIVDLYCSTNAPHPFREGNGRTQRAFFTQLIRSAGYEFSFADMDTELLMIATIQSAQGVTDMLKQIFHENIKNF